VTSNHQILGKPFEYHIYVTRMFPLKVGNLRTTSTHVTFSSTISHQTCVFSVCVFVMCDQ